MHFDTAQWALVIIGAFAVGLSKTGIGGLGVLAVALFASAMPSRESVGVLLPILISADIIAVAAYRRHAVWSHLLQLFPWTALGVVLGCLTMGWIKNDKIITAMIGVILVVLVLVTLWRRKAGGQPVDSNIIQSAKPAFKEIFYVACVGILAGFTTMVANAAGPIMILYFLAARLPKMEFIGTGAWFFLVLNVFKVPFSYKLHLINTASLPIDCILAPVAMVGAVAGRLLIRFINQALFENIALALTLLAGIRLLIPH